MEENEKRRNVELAYLSLMLSGKKVSECELASEVLKISRAKGEKSLAMLVQSSIKITVKVLSVVLEESSKRYVITFRQLGEDSDETIRSERTDGRRGKDVMQLWGRDLKNHILHSLQAQRGIKGSEQERRISSCAVCNRSWFAKELKTV